jgi:hypothetical protein
MQMIPLKEESRTPMMGMRSSALPIRARISDALAAGQAVTVDFSGIEATQSFVDELIGVLVSTQGPSILEKVTFKGCSASVRGIIQFVVSDRARDFARCVH